MKKTPQQKAMKWQREADELLAAVRAKYCDLPPKELKVVLDTLGNARQTYRDFLASHAETCHIEHCRAEVQCQLLLLSTLMISASLAESIHQSEK